MKILVLGISGMLGNAMLRVLFENSEIEVFGTARNPSIQRYFSPEISKKIIVGVDVENQDIMTQVFANVKPHTVINCIGLIKQLAIADDPLQALPINAMLPHRLARLCELCGARLVHISTDCVFAGSKGNYRESDPADAVDLYGRSKHIGEVVYPNTITLRTSIIGHELSSSHALLGWFLAQEGEVKGYTKAIFSGLPTVELARIIRDVVIPKRKLTGIYHVASAPIAKHDLLKLIADIYGKKITIIPDDTMAINRSLNAERFKDATGYEAPPWPDLVRLMHKFN